MAFLESVRNTNLKENIGVSTNLKNENATFGSAKAKKGKILCDVANTVNRNQNVLKSAKKADVSLLKASVSRTPFTNNLPKKTGDISKLLFRDRIEHSAPPKVHVHTKGSYDGGLDAYDGECLHCEKYNGIDETIRPTLTALNCEKLTMDPFPRRNKKFQESNFKQELIMPQEFDDNDLLADIGMLPSPKISSFTFKALQQEFEFETFDVPPVYNSDSE